ncbi:MAG: hypothetical protein P8Y70_00300 [Candidatus Lokiarchaeota archaeon]
MKKVVTHYESKTYIYYNKVTQDKYISYLNGSVIRTTKELYLFYYGICVVLDEQHPDFKYILNIIDDTLAESKSKLEKIQIYCIRSLDIRNFEELIQKYIDTAEKQGKEIKVKEIKKILDL